MCSVDEQIYQSPETQLPPYTPSGQAKPRNQPPPSGPPLPPKARPVSTRVNKQSSFGDGVCYYNCNCF